MSVVLKRQLSAEDQSYILKQHGRNCFATGHPIPDNEKLHFDHIVAFGRHGGSELDNIAPMCAHHNQEKGTLPLKDFRTRLRIQEFFNGGDQLTLKHLLEFLKNKGEIDSFGSAVAMNVDGGRIVVQSSKRKYSEAIQTCPTTGWKYFYCTLNVELIDSDDDQDEKIGLQPRYLIFDKVFDLYRHFQQHPVLQPSIGRVVKDHIRLFDGQHKIAALLWNDRKDFECKIYVDPDLRLLNQTNISAHDKFAQTRFFSSVMVGKLGAQFGLDFEAYKNLENGDPKTERGFMDFLARRDTTLSQAQLNTRFRSYLYNSVLTEESNQVTKLVSATNRSTDDKPLTIDLLSKSIFANFIYRQPTDDNMASPAHLRDDEIQNVVELLNSLNELALCEWNPKASIEQDKQRQLDRIVRSKSMMSWAEILRDAVCAKLELVDQEERAKPLYRKLSEKQREQLRDVVRRLVNWKLWVSPKNDEIDRILSDNKGEVKEWFKKRGLTTGYLMGAPE